MKSRKEWIKAYQDRGWARKDAERAVNTLLEVLTEAVEAPREVRFGKIGILYPEKRPGRTIVNNVTGKTFHKGEHYLFKFHLFKSFQQKVRRKWFPPKSDGWGLKP